MGVWGTGLYSGDFALDLRSTVSAVARLPFEGDKLVDILCGTEPRAADNSDDEEHATFWLVVADQFAKRSITCDRARDKALAIIENGSDLAMHEKLGMKPPDLAKRRKMLEDLRVRLLARQATSRPGTVLKQPQTLLMDVGDALVYPTCEGECINPYVASKEQSRNGAGRIGWKQDSWSAMIIIDVGACVRFPRLVSPTDHLERNDHQAHDRELAPRCVVDDPAARSLLGRSLQENGIGEGWDTVARQGKAEALISGHAARNISGHQQHFPSQRDGRRSFHS